ncbi:hypothetical protein FQA39_LY13908 [Lamprigera yunnana]|nr:hypothetical protein FQA39_LY13908 [Lamprigera yunnana]
MKDELADDGQAIAVSLGGRTVSVDDGPMIAVSLGGRTVSADDGHATGLSSGRFTSFSIIAIGTRVTEVSVRTIEKIIKEESTLPEAETNKIFKSPEKKNEIPFTMTAMEDYEFRDFRNIIYNFHNTENCRITVSALQEKLSNDLGWTVIKNTDNDICNSGLLRMKFLSLNK